MNVKYTLSLLTGVFECLLFSGLIFGWASLVYVLKEDGYFCEDTDNVGPTVNLSTAAIFYPTEESLSSVNWSSVSSSYNIPVTSPPIYQVNTTIDDSNSTKEISKVCSVEQSVQLNRVFTVASMLLSFSTLPNGFIFDALGTWVARVVSLVLFTTGCIFNSVCTTETSWILYISMSCMSVGGILMLITNMQIGNLFGKYRSSVITLMSGSLDSSSFVFLIFKTLHHAGISLSTLFQVLAWGTILLWIRTFTLLPRRNIPFPLPKGYNYGLNDCKRIKSDDGRELTTINGIESDEKKALNVTSSSDVKADVPTTMESVRTSLFWGNAIHFAILQLRNYFYLGMLFDYLFGLVSDTNTVSSYLTVFGTCQLFGFLCAPLNGVLVDGASKLLRDRKVNPDIIPLLAVSYSAAATTVLATVFSIFVAIPYLPLQYVSFVLQVVFRSFLYGGSSTFIAAAFPAEHFGKLYGLTTSFGGAVVFLQFPLISLVLNDMKGDFTVVNTIFVVLSALTILHPLNIRRVCRRKKAAKKRSIVIRVEE